MIDKENTVSSQLIYTGKTVSLRVDTVEVPNKGYKKREIVEHNGVVAVLGITQDNEVILVRQYRKSIEDIVLEIPAGKLELNENPKECAIREFREKTGYSAESLKLIHKFYPSVGFTDQMMFIYLAKKITKCEEIDDPQLVVEKMKFEELYEKVINNEIVDVKTSIGVLISKNII